MRRRQAFFGEMVLHVISASLKPLTAREIRDALLRVGEAASVNTIYRHLNRLVLLNLVQRNVDDSGRVSFCPVATSHFRVVCSRCGKSADATLPSDPYLRRAAEEATGYTVNGYRVSFDGICRECYQNQKQPVKKYRIKLK